MLRLREKHTGRQSCCNWSVACEERSKGGLSWRANLVLIRVAPARRRPERNFVRPSVEGQRLVFLALVHMLVAAARHEGIESLFEHTDRRGSPPSGRPRL